MANASFLIGMDAHSQLILADNCRIWGPYIDVTIGRKGVRRSETSRHCAAYSGCGGGSNCQPQEAG